MIKINYMKDIQIIYILIFFISGRFGDEKGYFGPWKTCKLLLYNRERCGRDESRFKVSSKYLTEVV